MAEENAKVFKGGPGRRPMGKRPKVDHPGKLLRRLLAYILKNYAPHCVLVLIGIFISVLANVQGTRFMQTLIDDYIVGFRQSGFLRTAACDHPGRRLLCGRYCIYICL